jgi:ribonuclease VapC
VIIDSSALIAVIKDEPEALEFASFMASPGTLLRISAANFLEAAMVADNSGDRSIGDDLDDLIRATGVRVEAITREHAEIARRAHRQFGRGSGHPARLNFGDCFTYALAVAFDEPVLAKGDEFRLAGLRALP